MHSAYPLPPRPPPDLLTVYHVGPFFATRLQGGPENQFSRIDGADEDISPYTRPGNVFVGGGVLTAPQHLNVEVGKNDFRESHVP